MRRTVLKSLAALAVSAAFCTPVLAANPVEISFYYPVAVGGAVTKTIDSMVADFEKAHPDIKVKAIYAGTYQESIVKALTAFKGGTPPTLAVLLSTDLFTLIDENAILPIDSLASSAEDKKWIAGFYKGFMENSQTEGKTWGIPFQRSTIVMYYNKALFKEAGLNPDKAPANWNEMVEAAKKLTKRDAAGNVTQWGVKIPSTGFGYWMFQAMTASNDTLLMNSAGTKTYFDKPGAVQALQHWVDLTTKEKVMPAGSIEWGTTPKDFLEQKAAMVWTTTGNLTNIRTNASFPFGVAMLPGIKHPGSPTGGGNFYVFNKTSPAEQQAAMKFIRFATEPARAAQWSIATGYVAPRQDAWDTPEMKKYLQDVPAADVAREQMKYGVAELSTHDNQRVTKALNDNLQAALSDTKTPEAALKDAQREAERILRSYGR
ncbi:ABC transporter substrate-binding protein [Herbaspirillum seropedicae]|uniref:ABC-type sugar transport system, periplasmic component protein n=1 Tax=Herbaspirillum seropedicae (strain SmR1) TaxID=757424 RepID=D8J0L5_HERSS|nr:ABC transporter substrate-binding protein [Herbaspirillum seropedicae]ADJ64571.1 ABC-type sugar transport system, periplasmic component protein [Herbaspirillum seropedicae SmR1]AKN66497.1 ABC transporter substrate-binding protein [Herbaspirillum seropedicae]NQE30402.1 ABC transporter substrate-binding protein [Herbaspirillum seropedicae]UMU22486.1 ABC transporter substrate-binding protein [Herbaspirillum seropedicae]